MSNPFPFRCSRRAVLGAGAATLAGAAFGATPSLAQSSAPAAGASRMTAYAFAFDGLDGGAIRLADHAGKPILIVNTASQCGYTNQFSALAKLAERFGPRGLVVIGVPSNDFGGQEPGGPKDIRETAQEHGARFPLAAKTPVKGEHAHRFYKWAAAERPNDTPRWNFHKYLIGRDGRIAAVFSTQTTPDDPAVIAAIERELT